MKISNVKITSLFGLLMLPVQILCEEEVAVADATPIGPPQGDRYIVQYRAGSKEFETRMQAAKISAGGGVRGSSFPALFPDAGNVQLLPYGSFLPKDRAEVLYLTEEEVKEWNENDEVEYVELGTFGALLVQYHGVNVSIIWQTFNEPFLLALMRSSVLCCDCDNPIHINNLSHTHIMHFINLISISFVCHLALSFPRNQNHRLHTHNYLAHT